MNNLTILLAEDNDHQASLMTKALKQNKNVRQVVRFHNGQEILEYLFMLADENRYGEKYVILLDTQMSRVGGIEVLKAVKRHVALKVLPVIMFSSVNDPKLINLCYHYGCNAFIPRPLDHNRLECFSTLNFISIMQVPVIPADIISKIATGGLL